MSITDISGSDWNRAQHRHPESQGDPLAYRIEDAGRRIGLGRTTMYAEIAAGRLKSFSVGKRRLISHAALAEYVADRMAETGQ